MLGIVRTDDGWIAEDCNSPTFAMMPTGELCIATDEAINGAVTLGPEEVKRLRQFLALAEQPRVRESPAKQLALKLEE